MPLLPIKPTDEDVTAVLNFRKRKIDQAATGEIEVDINAPEPPSKKAARKAKKEKPATHAVESLTIEAVKTASGVTRLSEPTSAPSKRSDHGIWIGNLPWTATKSDLRDFITKNADIKDTLIMRVHLPTSTDPAKQRKKPQNKGFAYVDLASKEALGQALALNETLFAGRRVLIKDAKSFEGRPEKKDEDNEALGTTPGKPPSKRIFVGNLTFDTTLEDLRDHFAQCGPIADVHVATFEDSGKCKGYAWVVFEDLSAAGSAVRGWIEYQGNEEGDLDTAGQDEEAKPDKNGTKKPAGKRKWWVNKFKGRQLRMEFAEDKTVRYRKRFVRGGESLKKDANSDNDTEEVLQQAEPVDGKDDRSNSKSKSKSKTPMRRRRDSGSRRAKVDPRTIKPGAAHAAAPRLRGSIVASQGKKTTFE
ncbi:MAG: hypothetical protein LQ342_007507 [Letrouitia transgressa]|nr:MAG: hypothetical protein LQ342_007507 [Letrouitia transgressa]